MNTVVSYRFWKGLFLGMIFSIPLWISIIGWIKWLKTVL